MTTSKTPPTKKTATPGSSQGKPQTPTTTQSFSTASKPGTGLTWAETMNLWTKAGGNPQAAAMAAAVADASSGLDPKASNANGDGTTSKGLWQINSAFGALASLDPLSNAHAAVQQSNNGSDWSNWCAAWSDNNCGVDGGSYLGEGSNVLAALKLRGGSYAIAGAAPAGDGSSAADATGRVGSSPGLYGGSSSSQSKPMVSHTMAYVIIGVLILGAVYFSMRGKKGSPTRKPDDAPGPDGK